MRRLRSEHQPPLACGQTTFPHCAMMHAPQGPHDRRSASRGGGALTVGTSCMGEFRGSAAAAASSC